MLPFCLMLVLGGMLYTDAEIDDHSIVSISIFISSTLTINFIGKQLEKKVLETVN